EKLASRRRLGSSGVEKVFQHAPDASRRRASATGAGSRQGNQGRRVRRQAAQLRSVASPQVPDLRTMRIPPDMISRLRKAQIVRARAATEKALAGKPITDDLARLESYEKLLGMAADPKRRNV